MPNVDKNQLFPLREAPNYLPLRRGKKIHYSTLFRWAKKGLRGRKLETKRLGGVLYTSMAALDRFEESSSATPTETQSALHKALYGKPR